MATPRDRATLWTPLEPPVVCASLVACGGGDESPASVPAWPGHHASSSSLPPPAPDHLTLRSFLSHGDCRPGGGCPIFRPCPELVETVSSTAQHTPNLEPPSPPEKNLNQDKNPHLGELCLWGSQPTKLSLAKAKQWESSYPLLSLAFVPCPGRGRGRQGHPALGQGGLDRMLRKYLVSSPEEGWAWL